MINRSFTILCGASALVLAAWFWLPRQPSANAKPNDAECNRTETTYEATRNSEGRFQLVVTSQCAADPESHGADVDSTESYDQPPSVVDANLLAQEQVAYWTAWIACLTVLGTAFLILTLRETTKATKTTADLLELEFTPFLSLELVDGHAYKVQGGRLGRRDGEGFREEPLMCRIVNGGRSAAVSAKLIRCWETTDPGRDPTPIDPLALEERVVKDILAIKESDIAIPIGPDGASPSITTFVDEFVPADGQWLYFHGILYFTDWGGKRSGRTGFCFLYNPKFPDRGFYVAVPKSGGKHWYYEALKGDL